MPLAEDQLALLRLLVEGEDYDRVAGVLGTSPGEVAHRARGALASLQADGSDDSLAAAARARLSELEGRGAEPDEVPERPGVGPPNGFRAVAAAAAAALAAVGVAVALFVIAGGGDGKADSNGYAADPAGDAVRVRLEPVGASRASGTAVLRRVADLPVIDVDARGLEPSPSGRSYVVWLLGESDRGVPIEFRSVGPEGTFSGRTRIPAAAAGLLPSIDTLVMTLADDRRAGAAIRRAARSRTLPPRVGEPVLRGSLRP